jgi:hypothetical protein
MQAQNNNNPKPNIAIDCSSCYAIGLFYLYKMSLRKKYIELIYDIININCDSKNAVDKCVNIADKQTLDFAKWLDKNYFQGEENNSYAKCKGDFRNKETTFNLKQLFLIFKRERSETVA